MANIPKVWNGTAFIELEAAATVAPAASTTVVGIVQLTDSTSSTSTTTAATPNSVKSAFDLAGTAIPKNTVTAAGDILYASGSATVARLGIGTASQVLGIAAGVPAWTTPAGGGGITCIGTVIATAGTAISFTSIPATYKDLVIQWANVTQSVTNVGWAARFNSDAGSAYTWRGIAFNGTVQGNGTILGTQAGNAGAGFGVILTSGTASAAGQDSVGELRVYRYTDLAQRQYSWQCTGTEVGAASPNKVVIGVGMYKSSGSAITSIEFIRESTQTITGTFYLYGVS